MKMWSDLHHNIVNILDMHIIAIKLKTVEWFDRGTY
jgi:hypothetical protein